MLLVLGKMTLKPELIAAYEVDYAAMLPKVLTEDGCHYYSLSVDDRSTGVIAVAELWRDEAALMKHFEQPWIIDFMGKYGEQILDSTVKIYDADNERPLPGS